MGKVIESGQQVLVVLRHDPASSDPVDVAMVINAETMWPHLNTERQLYKAAEAYAIDREITWIRRDAKAGDYDYRPDAVVWANSLTTETLTKETDIWFEVVEMPVILQVHDGV